MVNPVILIRTQYGLESMSLYWFLLRFLTSYSLSETSIAKYDKNSQPRNVNIQENMF